MILGITGISGSGKHTAADFFAQRGWEVADADKIAHELYRPYTHVWKAVVKQFGEGILNKDDSINRAKVGAIVFGGENSKSSAKNLKALNAIVHPAVQRHLKEKALRNVQRGTDMIVVAALWKEIGLSEIADRLLLVRADPELALRRIKARDGVSETVYESRVKNQSEPSAPDFVVENSGTFQELYEKLNRLELKIRPEKIKKNFKK